MTDSDITMAVLTLRDRAEGGYTEVKGYGLEVLEQLGACIKSNKQGSRIDPASIKRFCLNCRLLEKYGLPIWTMLQAGTVVLEQGGVTSQQSDSVVHSEFFPHIEGLAEGYKGEDDSYLDYLELELRGQIEYDSDTGAVAITSAGKRLGLSQGNLKATALQLLQREQPTRSLAVLRREIAVEELLQLVSKRLTRPTNYDLLSLAYKAHPEFHLPQGLAIPEFTEWATLPELNEHRQLIQEMARVYGNDGDSRTEAILSRLLTALAGRTIEPGCVVQWYPVLRGPGGSGKTSLAEGLAIGGSYVTSDATSLPKIDSLVGSSVLALDEIDVLARKKELSEMKSFVSQTAFKTRLAYRKDSEVIQATWVIIATTNADSVEYGDGAGQRRQAIIDIPGDISDGERRVAWLHKNRDRLHALGVALFNGGYSPNLSKENVDNNKESNETFISAVPEFESLHSRLDTLAEIVVSDGVLTGLGHEHLWALVSSRRWHTRHTSELKTMMTSAGWTYYRVPSSRAFYWLPPNLDIDKATIHPVHEDNLLNMRTILARA